MVSRTAAAAATGDYRIEVTDFGPIEHAEIDVRPLTVFAGPSNTGKSYLAMLVYALHRLFGSSQLLLSRLAPYPSMLTDSMIASLPNGDALIARIRKWWPTTGWVGLEPLPDDVADQLRPAMEQVGPAGSLLSRDVSRCFGVDALTDLVRRGSEQTTVTVSVPSAGVEPVRYCFQFDRECMAFSGQVPATPLFFGRPDDEYAGQRTIAESVPSGDNRFLLYEIMGAVVRGLIDPLTRPAYYLPADRTGVMHSHQVVVSTLIQSATTAGLRSSTNSAAMLSGVLADFLEGLISMESRTGQQPDRLAQILEKNLVPGSVRLQPSETGYPSFAYRPAGWDADLPLMRTSSMVSELAPVVLYLRYFVRPGDLLIIEEPESHLHPAMQAAFARELARLVHAGVRVMLTTHSEWILEALANLVRLAEIPERERKGITGADVALAANQVGAWMFTPNADGAGSTVEEIPLDTEAGTFPAGYGDITESLYNDWAKISNRIEVLRSGGA